jgi:hypothetical protein
LEVTELRESVEPWLLHGGDSAGRADSPVAAAALPALAGRTPSGRKDRDGREGKGREGKEREGRNEGTKGRKVRVV